MKSFAIWKAAADQYGQKLFKDRIVQLELTLVPVKEIILTVEDKIEINPVLIAIKGLD